MTKFTRASASMVRHAALSTLVIALLALSGVTASAQDTGAEVSVTVAGLASFQPTDQSYVGSPYLDQALGGVGPGVLLGLHVEPVRHFIAGVEFTSARLEVQQSGRIVGATNGSVPGRVRDSMLSALVGAQVRSGQITSAVLAGVSALLDTPTSDGEPLDFGDEPMSRVVLTLGLDVARAITPRMAFNVTTRAYLGVDRTESQRQVGLGRQIYRVGAGLRLVF